MPYTNKILIVDDDPGARETLELLLLNHGYQLVFASNGREALALAAELTPDLILLDVMMAEMDGFMVCQRLRAAPRLAEVPIIMITALDDRDSRMRALDAGADDFVSKPFDWAELRARVQSTLRLNRYRRLLVERTKFAWVVEQADDGYMMVTDRGSICYANAQARRYLGLPPDEDAPILTPFLALASKHYRCEPHDSWTSWLERRGFTGAAPLYLVLPETQDVRACWLQVDSFDLPGGLETGWLIRLRDVTAQKDLERDVGTFHIAISHKMRTPLVGLLGSLEVLALHAPTLPGEDVAAFANAAFKSAQRLHGEIEDILQYIDASALAQPSEGFLLADLRATVAAISADVGLESVAVMENALGDIRLAFSRRAVEIVLWQLFENAKKFHPKRAPIVEVVAFRSSATEVNIEVRDDGITLSPEQLAMMGTPYYQNEKRFTGQVPGMGLGLALVADLVWGSGGTYGIANRDEGRGVVVKLTVPLVQHTDVRATSAHPLKYN
jgi:two-component system, cell cycle response regulator